MQMTNELPILNAKYLEVNSFQKYLQNKIYLKQYVGICHGMSV